jgi:hypothetical protein
LVAVGWERWEGCMAPRFLIGTPEKRPPERQKCRWEDNIKNNVKQA